MEKEPRRCDFTGWGRDYSSEGGPVSCWAPATVFLPVGSAYCEEHAPAKFPTVPPGELVKSPPDRWADPTVKPLLFVRTFEDEKPDRLGRRRYFLDWIDHNGRRRGQIFFRVPDEIPVEPPTAGV